MPNAQQIFGTEQFTWNRETLTFVAELSDLSLPGAPRQIDLRSHKTGKIVRFVLKGRDMSPCGEDIAGFRYRSTDDLLRLLLIND
jgi:hypothetical protein